ncbi:MAG: ABC transporter permease [bacterium]|nr:ABC transporter permease [bacterium]MDE0352227.1 ABC transporter permease [bacterium]
MRALFLVVGSLTGRLMRRRRSIAMLFLTGALAPLLFFLSLGRSGSFAAEMYNDLTFSLGMATLYPVAALVVSTAALGEERKAHTLPFLLLKPVPRAVIALGALIAAAVSSFVILEAGVLVTWLVAGVMSGDWTIGMATTVGVAIQSVASAALFVPLGLVLNRATLFGLGYLFLWEGILSSIIGGIQASSIYRIVVSASADFATMTIDTYDTVDVILGRVAIGAGGAAAKVAVMALVSVLLTGSILKRRDLVGE